MLQLQHQDHVLAPRLSATQNVGSRRLVSRFRCVCYGLHVNTSNVAEQKVNLNRELRFHLVCGSDTAEDTNYFSFDCPAHCAIRDRFTAIFWGPAPAVSFFLT